VFDIADNLLTGVLTTGALLTAFSMVEAAQKPVSVKELAGWPKIDAHAHLMSLRAEDKTALFEALERWNTLWLTVCTRTKDSVHLNSQIELAAALHAARPDRVAWITSFDLEGWGRPGWDSLAVQGIVRDAARGAVGVKAWKDIGMVLRDPDGRFVLLDDPRFEPVFSCVESLGLTLLIHTAEPRSCWLPLESMPSPNDRNYYENHPQYHAFLHPEIPDYWTLIEARDRLLARHPKLRVVGCHLASLEFDLDEVALRLERHPNLAVDLAERVYYLQMQDRRKAHDFMMKYQDRILYGTDLTVDSAGEPPLEIGTTLTRMDSVYSNDLRYFATDERMTDWKVEGEFQGLALPDSVLRKIFFENAKKWLLGL